jgi:hypothetical protein
MEKRAKHYERINEVLKHLHGIRFETVGRRGYDDIFRDYSLSIKLPNELYLYDKAVLHLKQEDDALGKALQSLPKLLMVHNKKVDSAEDALIEKLIGTFTSHKLTYDRTGDLFHNTLWILSSVWRAHNRDLIRASNRASRLLDYFTGSILRDCREDVLYLGVQPSVEAMAVTYRPVWRGSEQEKISVIESMKIVLVDSVVLDSLNELGNAKSGFEASLSQISRLAERVSKAIEADDYTAKAKCCPTVLGLIRDYFF